MSEILELLKTAEFLRFGTLMALILFGNYKRIWVWGSELRAAQEELKSAKLECAKVTADATVTIEKWQNRTLQATGYAETAMSIKKAVP